MKNNSKIDFQIRGGNISDCAAIAWLSNQLGYPASSQSTRERLKAILSSEDDVVYLAEMSDNRVIGWIHGYKTTILETEPYAEIGGLVVSETQRNLGVGSKLLKSVEEWASSSGIGLVRIRSNIIREDAHIFYNKRGYDRTKTQHVYLKQV